MIGNTDFKSILAVINYLKSLEAALNFVLEPAFTKPLCYKHLVEALCYTVLPKCDLDSGQVIHPRKETCEELIYGCIEKSLFMLCSLSVLNKRFLAHLAQNINGDYRSNNLINCNYLPSFRHHSLFLQTSDMSWTSTKCHQCNHCYRVQSN